MLRSPFATRSATQARMRAEGQRIMAKNRLYSNDWTTFHSAKDLGAYVEENDNDQEEIYEVLQDGAVRVFMDLEHVDSERTTTAHLIILGRFRDFINDTMSLPLRRTLDAAILNASRPTASGMKHSYHIHLYNLYCTSLRAHQKLIVAFKETLPDGLSRFVDVGVYGIGRLFRCYRQYKNREPLAKLIWECHTDTTDAKDTIITVDGPLNGLVCVDLPPSKVETRVPKLEGIGSISMEESALGEFFIPEGDADDELYVPGLSDDDEVLEVDLPSMYPKKEVLEAIVPKCKKITGKKSLQFWWKASFLSPAMYYALSRTYEALRVDFAVHHQIWPKNPLVELTVHRGRPAFAYSFPRYVTGCGTLTEEGPHYHPHLGGQSSSCVILYFKPESCSIEIYCHACKDTPKQAVGMEFTMPSRFSTKLLRGDRGSFPSLTPGCFVDTRSTHVFIISDIIQHHMKHEFLITNDGCAFQFNQSSLLYKLLSPKVEMQKAYILQFMLRHFTPIYRQAYSLGLHQVTDFLVHPRDNIFETKKSKRNFKGLLSRNFNRFNTATGGFFHMLDNIEMNVEEHSTVSTNIESVLPLVGGTLLDFNTKTTRKRTMDDLCYFEVKGTYNNSYINPKVSAFFKSLIVPQEVNEHFQSDLHYLQLMLGYWMTGRTNERAVFFNVGEGRNGKSVLVDLVRYCLGDFASTVQSSFLKRERQSNQDGAQTALAGTRGKRVVFVNELEQGDPMDCAKIKTLSGDDAITARVVFSPVIEKFSPTAKVIVSSNHYPDFQNDKAVYDRVLFFKFERRFCDGSEKGVESDPYKEYADANFIAAVKEDGDSLLTYLANCAMMYESALAASEKGHVLRQFQPSRFAVECKNESMIYDLKSMLLQYVDILPKSDEKFQPEMITYTAFTDYVLPQIIQKIKRLGCDVNQTRLMKEIRSLELEDEDGETFKTKSVHKSFRVNKLMKCISFVHRLALQESHMVAYSHQEKSQPVCFSEVEDEQPKKKRKRQADEVSEAVKRYRKYQNMHVAERVSADNY
jgi:P4 family phage/plasmid primase-like protien